MSDRVTNRVSIGDATLYLGNCLDLLPSLGPFDVVITDPPYPDYHVELYGEADISFLDCYPCRQLVFWSTRAEFPLTWTARHVWDKRKGGAGSAYEFIYERNGRSEQWVMPYVSIQNETRADFAQDTFTGHKSQKPRKLMERLVAMCAKGSVFDPYMGSGSTGVACAQLGYPFIGIERNPDWFDVAAERVSATYAQGRLFA